MRYLWYGFLGLFSLGILGLIVGVIGVAATLNHYGQDLPDYENLKDYNPPVVTRLYAGDGRLLAEFAEQKRVFIPIDNIPELVSQAFISAEDQNFYTHTGVDYKAIAGAMVSNLKNMSTGRRPRGASTITQQVAKNFLLTNEVSYERKIKEAILAYRLEKALSKEKLLELYLNEIYLGGGTYGVGAAALYYFDKPLNELNVDEAAYLAALPKAPNNYHPVRKHDAAVARRDWVIGRMVKDGYISESQAELARLQPLKITEKKNDRTVSAPYFAEEVRRELAEVYGSDGLYQSGMSVRTSVDPAMQKIAEITLRDGLTAYDRRHGYRGEIASLKTMDDWQAAIGKIKTPKGMLDEWRMGVVIEVGKDTARIGFKDGGQGTTALKDMKWARKSLNDGYALGAVITRVSQALEVGDVIVVSPLEDSKTAYALEQIPKVQGALIALDPHTGRILAMQGGWQYAYGGSEFNRATQASRQPGSAFKPFVYLAALDNGFTPATLVLDAPFTIEDRPGNFWSPSNYSGDFYGPTPIRVGVEKSKNLMTVRLADYIGMDKISELAKRFGIDDDMPPLLANSLGAGETTLLKLTSAYAVLVNGGKKITPTFIDRVQGRDGSTVFKHDERDCNNCGDRMRWRGQNMPFIPDTREQIANPVTAYQMVSILEGVVQRGTGVRIRSLDRPLAGKTGTTNESKDAWFIGFSPDLVVGVFVGFDEPKSLGKRETGSSVAVPVFKDFMEQALKDEPITPFRIPPNVRQVQVNAKTGARAGLYDENVIWESFVTGTEPTGQMYILNESGIQPYYGGAGIGFDPFAPQSVGGQNAEQGGVLPPPPSAGAEATTGTGGLY